MIIGCTKELKKHEYRVGLTPANVRAYVQAGHRVLLEQGAGLGHAVLGAPRGTGGTLRLGLVVQGVELVVDLLAGPLDDPVEHEEGAVLIVGDERLGRAHGTSGELGEALGVVGERRVGVDCLFEEAAGQF